MSSSEAAGPAAREVLAQTADVRVQLVTLATGGAVPWHFHSHVSDTIVAVVGTVVVETRDPPARHALASGQHLTLAAGAVHRVAGDGDGACRFINVHAGGPYDFRAIAVEPP